ncbi:MAG: alpha/beta fold hydrolase [Chromatiales bacterium]|nr:alpha/beta fold hydrolase [Chromatiales bacterium]
MQTENQGVSIRYQVTGGGPHLTLVHGVGGAMDAWDGVVAELAGEFELLRYDLRGHGESGKPPGPYHIDDFVSDLRALLDARGVERTTVVGFSMGGMIGQAFALAEPARTERLILISAVAGRTEPERAAVIARADALASGGASQTIDAALERWFTPEFRAAHPEIIEARRKRATTSDPAAYAAAYRVFAETELAARLGEIACPTLVVTGEHDAGSTPRMAALMHERIRGSRLEILPRLRHSVLIEAPTLVSELIRDFVVGSAPPRRRDR